MKHKARLFLVTTALAAAGVATVAQAANTTPQARKAAIEKIAKNHANFKQPQTMTEANATKVRMPNGAVGIAVPVELWNNLTVQKDAQGTARVVESDGATADASSQEVRINE
jgi:hypothetical protein